MGKTKIEWCDAVWNPCTGCSSVSEGCRNCYAERLARRLAGRYGYPEAPHHFDVTLHPDRLEEPLHWRKPRMVFVCSMGDLFHEDVPDDFIIDVFARMVSFPEHTWQILTKRPQRMLEFVERYALQLANWPCIWLGVTAENQEQANKRIPILSQIPAAVRFVSVEPMLGPVDLSRWLGLVTTKWEAWPKYKPDIDWVICGGESGPSARPMHPQWPRDLRDQCQVASVLFFHKQNGEWLDASTCVQTGLIFPGRTYPSHKWEDGSTSFRVGKKAAGRLLDGREWNEYPQVKAFEGK